VTNSSAATSATAPPVTTIPDPTLMARLQLSVKGVDWAASLVAHRQHEQVDGEWSAHQHVSHLIAVETNVFQPRVQRMIDEDRPVFEPWDEEGYMTTAYRPDGEVADLQRPVEEVREDVRQGYVSAQAAAELYGVAIDPDSFVVDMVATEKLRAAGHKARSASA